ncbi:MAG: ABC transporter permease [Chloroflexi bacterium]|nr:ABC transporter permease [Chloroflexota bacterium]
MKAYLSIIRLRFAVQLQYRAAAAAGFFTQFFFGFVYVMVFHAFYASSAVTQPMSLQQVVTYTWLAQATLRMQPTNADTEVASLIRSGNVAYELCRPLNLYFIWYCRLISRMLVPTMLSGIPLFFIAFFLPKTFGATLPVSPAAGAAWLASTLIALFLGCAISNLITVSTLWTISGVGMQRMFPAAVMVFSGINVPLAFFPDSMQQVLRLLPFSGLIDIPLRLYLGMIPASQVFLFGLLELAWTGVFIAIGLQLLALGMKRVVIQGG